MIRLNVFIKTTEANRAELIRTGRELVAASLQDEGCIGYDLFESTTRPDILMICETWSSDESLTTHQQAPHFKALVPRIHALGEMKLERYDF